MLLCGFYLVQLQYLLHERIDDNILITVDAARGCFATLFTRQDDAHGVSFFPEGKSVLLQATIAQTFCDKPKLPRQCCKSSCGQKATIDVDIAFLVGHIMHHTPKRN